VVQNLNVALGQNQQTMTITSSPHESMAMICRITRNVIFSPQFRTLQEWFHYAFAPSEIDGKWTDEMEMKDLEEL